MKTDPIDFILCSVSITLIVGLSLLTTILLSIDSPYHVVLDIAVFMLSYGLFTILLLAIIRRFKPYPVGSFSMDSGAFTYWKLVAVLSDLAEKALRPFNTVFTQPLIFVGFGVSVGRQVAIAGTLRDHPLIELGDFATIGQNSVITAHAITHDMIEMKPVRIGNHAVVGINCVVMPGVTLGDYAVLAPGAVATVGTKIPARELWAGIPARRLKSLDPDEGESSRLAVAEPA